jgi:hypothetical protein
LKGAATVNIRGKEVKVRGKLIRIARIAEGYEFLDDPAALIAALRESGRRVDLLTFTQRLCETTPKFAYPFEWDNLAAVRLTTFDEWFARQINRKTRNMIRKAERSGVTVREVPFDDALVAGISTINNETPIRQGRPFWHYGDDLETVRKENGTFQDRSIFIGAFLGDMLIGYAKLTSDERYGQAGLMQIVSMIGHRDKAPTNMLIAQAVRSCAERRIPFLWYARYSYRNKRPDTLAAFKQHNGFEQIDLPRYYVPLTPLGRAALRLGLQHSVTDRIPESWSEKARDIRNRWYAARSRRRSAGQSVLGEHSVALSPGEESAATRD